MSVALRPEGNGGAETDQTAEEQDGQPGEQQVMSDEALYAIEVKEQDRWLPIANGMLRFHFFVVPVAPTGLHTTSTGRNWCEYHDS